MELFPLVLCTRGSILLQMLLCCFTLYNAFTVLTLIESLSRAEHWVFKQWVSCYETKYPLVHSPHQKIHHRNYIDGVPIDARDCLCLTDL